MLAVVAVDVDIGCVVAVVVACVVAVDVIGCAVVVDIAVDVLVLVVAGCAAAMPATKNAAAAAIASLSVIVVSLSGAASCARPQGTALGPRAINATLLSLTNLQKQNAREPDLAGAQRRVLRRIDNCDYGVAGAAEQTWLCAVPCVAG